MPAGRPSKYKPSTAKGICLRLMSGQSLNEICAMPQYPHKQTVLNWIHKYPEFFDQYKRAREVQQEHFLDEMLDIADDASNDWMERNDREGNCVGWQENHDSVNRSKLRIHARQWVMERMAPKRFGSKQAIDHTSSDNSMSQKPTIIELTSPSESTDTDSA